MTCAEVNSHLYQVRVPPSRVEKPRLKQAPQVKTLAEEIGVAFLGLGFQPKWSVADTPAMPKERQPVSRLAPHLTPFTNCLQGRYKIMREYMPKVGSMGLDMMFRTCTVQVNLDFSSEEDMVKKFRVGLALQVRTSDAAYAQSLL